MNFKYKECNGCYWKYNSGCIRPKGESCPGRLVAEYKKKEGEK